MEAEKCPISTGMVYGNHFSEMCLG